MDCGPPLPPKLASSGPFASPQDDVNSPIGSGFGSVSASKSILKPSKTQMSCQECRRLKLKCDRVWPCNQCRKRGRSELCPHGVSKPPGRALRLNAELQALLKRCEDLEAALTDVGAASRIPPPIPIEFAGRALGKTRATEAQDDAMEDYESPPASDSQVEASVVESVLQGVGSLSIREEDGRVRYLGASAGPAYYFQDDGEPSSESDETSSADQSTQLVRAPFIQLSAYYSRSHEIDRLRALLPHQAELKRLAKNYYQFLSFQFEPVEEDVFYDDYLPAACRRSTKLLERAYLSIELSLKICPSDSSSLSMIILSMNRSPQRLLYRYRFVVETLHRSSRPIA